MAKGSVSSISVVGLGKLGLSLAAVLADSGFVVRGVELDKAKVDSINKGRSPIYEPGLDELVKKASKRLFASSKFSGQIAPTQVTFVVVPTPSEESGAFSTKLVENAMKSVGEELKGKKEYHLVVLTSTVGPGSMDGAVVPTLEKASGKKLGDALGLCYNPEFIALGDVIRGLREPDFILIGESDKMAGDLLVSVQRRICKNSPSFERMEFVNAELAKIAVNSYVTMKMSFANTLAEIAENLPRGNVDRITTAVGRDKRIGGTYLKGATGYGGTCFPRDNVAFAHYAKKVGAQALIAEATHNVNLGQPERLVALIKRRGFSKKTRIGVLGLSFKPNTNIVEQSQALMLSDRLARGGYRVTVFDPAALESARAVLKDSVGYARSAVELVKDNDLIVLATPWPEFGDLPANLFRGKSVFDSWRFFGEDVRRKSKYSSIGTA